MIRETLFACLVTLSIVALSCNAQKDQQPDPVGRYIQQRGDSIYKSGEVPGMLVSILRNGQRQYFNFGYAAPDNKVPFDSATIYEIGSITKTFTAYVLVAVLMEKGISDTSKILPYLPDSVQRNTSLSHISFLSLMNHSSGLPRLPSNIDMVNDPMAPYDHYTEGQLYTYLKSATPTTNGASAYSNLGAGLAGVLAARIAGASYETLLDKHMFQPFGLKRHSDESIAAEEHKAQGHFDIMKSNYWKADALAPAGTLKCTSAEILTYFQSMINPPTAASRQIVDTLLRPTLTVLPSMRVCRGWFTVGADSLKVYWHNGGTYGFSTFGAFNREKNVAVSIVINKFDHNPISDEFGLMIMQKLLQ
ncbi:MAG: beta-lactamase family protein [Chitinophagaceae bacterium]|nr:beta-lactamase family protein [Chitinophagaceae bacterium]